MTSTEQLVNGGSHQVEPLVFSDDDADCCVSSPKQHSPVDVYGTVDASYCGTMKSDDSGIVMGETKLCVFFI